MCCSAQKLSLPFAMLYEWPRDPICRDISVTEDDALAPFQNKFLKDITMNHLEQAQHGESVSASPSPTNDMSSSRRGGLHSHQGSGGSALLQLRNGAHQRGLKGRSSMNKTQLEQALNR